MIVRRAQGFNSTATVRALSRLIRREVRGGLNKVREIVNVIRHLYSRVSGFLSVEMAEKLCGVRFGEATESAIQQAFVYLALLLVHFPAFVEVNNGHDAFRLFFGVPS